MDGRVCVGDEADETSDVEGGPVLRAAEANDHEPLGRRDDDALALRPGGEEGISRHATAHPPLAEVAGAAIGKARSRSPSPGRGRGA